MIDFDNRELEVLNAYGQHFYLRRQARQASDYKIDMSELELTQYRVCNRLREILFESRGWISFFFQKMQKLSRAH